jgi:hypothetical protein
MDEWMNGWMGYLFRGGRPIRPTDRSDPTDGRMDGLTDGMDGWMNGWMDGWMDGLTFFFFACVFDCA